MVSKRLVFAAAVAAWLGPTAVASARDGENRRSLPGSDHIVRDDADEIGEAAKGQRASAPVRYFPRAERGSVEVRFSSDLKAK